MSEAGVTKTIDYQGGTLHLARIKRGKWHYRYEYQGEPLTGGVVKTIIDAKQQSRTALWRLRQMGEATN